jgi:adhesin HecA-like repeat protein
MAHEKTLGAGREQDVRTGRIDNRAGGRDSVHSLGKFKQWRYGLSGGILDGQPGNACFNA